MADDGRRSVDIEQARHGVLVCWSDLLDCQIARFQLAIARGKARREHDVRGLAAVDQAAALLRDESRRARSRLRKLRDRLRRLRSGGGPGRPLTP
jgi:hypothetical protein